MESEFIQPLHEAQIHSYDNACQEKKMGEKSAIGCGIFSAAKYRYSATSKNTRLKAAEANDYLKHPILGKVNASSKS
jgi:hypothetical protein